MKEEKIEEYKVKEPIETLKLTEEQRIQDSEMKKQLGGTYRALSIEELKTKIKEIEILEEIETKIKEIETTIKEEKDVIIVMEKKKLIEKIKEIKKEIEKHLQLLKKILKVKVELGL